MITHRRPGPFVCVALVVLMALGALLVVSPGTSLAAGPEFSVYASTPDSAMPGETFNITIGVENTGTERSHAPLTIADTVSPGLATPFPSETFVVQNTSVFFPETSEEGEHPLSCEASGPTYTCTTAQALPPGGQFRLLFESTVEGSASGTLVNHVSVTGGGVGTSTSQQEIAVGPPGPFAIKQASATLLDSANNPVQQAAAVPADFTTALHFRTATGPFLGGLIPITASTEHFKNVTVHLPVGLIGNPTATPKCTAAELTTSHPFNSLMNETELKYATPSCPEESQVGIVHLELSGFEDGLVGLYNMVPPPGAASELAFEYAGAVVTLDAYVRPDDHGIDIVSRNTSTTLPATDVEVTAWGDPASHSHDRVRGRCLGSIHFFPEGGNGAICPSNAPETAFLRLPTSCSGEGLAFGAESNSYEKPDTTVSASFTGPALSGCEKVPFSPTIFVQPTATAANSPTGLAVQLSNPQNSNPQGLAEADLKKAVVTLPEGMALNPSSADGLAACSDEQFRVASAGPAECPDASKVGTVVLHTPLLESPIEGGVYVLSQQSSDPESGQMFRIGMELRDDRHGIDIKVTGALRVNRSTGRITTTFDNNPQLPFSDITLHFKSGARAPLTTPASCVSQTTEADLYSWAQPETAVHSGTTFGLTSGPNGTPCTTTQPFNPGLNAGVSSVQAGGFTPYLTTFTRADSDQSMQRVSVKLPSGLLGSLVGLPLCGEAAANTGTCSQASQIGSVTAGAGTGPTPLYVTGGKVFMTGSYEGAPFGLSVVVPAKAGPFDLGTVVVRARVDVDPITAQLTVTTDPLPQIVGGVPVDLRLVNVTIDRPNFTFNPTNCNPMSITGMIAGGQGAVASLANHFQVTNCGALAFKPRLQASTAGRTSRSMGASLHVKLTYPKAPFGSQANIAKVKVDLPKQLPSRLSTMQKACTAKTFEANPAACPLASRVGEAKASTPILPEELHGPAYFVSYGGAKFPELVMVLSGYGVTVDLHGETFINEHTNVTSSTFRQVPDVPVGSFELTLPQGANSALAATANLCASTLTMPTAFTAQDGTTIKQSTPITPTGCPKQSTKKKRKHANKAGRGVRSGQRG